ncbi:restriction endonuclease subunit S [Phocaeicola sartorii]|uniref:restriction endonuclease subunit S n=2 Tax=Phocaeicola sartorii TaxID=671267 RepID=UPI00214BFF50|nr:restriction endonuclease subunit S [Phocaeicola sartorii]MCR1843531.1 restriction endonuclease subunit S [Phocaeicola sartorii]
MANNNENKILNVPNLRFPEFTGEWKVERLDEIATLSKGIGISKEQVSNDGELCILYGELYTKYKSEIIKEISSRTNIDNSKLKRSKANDVIIPCSGETAVDIATARCVPFDNILLGGDLNIISLYQYDGAFMSYQLNGKRKYDIAKVAQGVSVVHLYGEHLKAISTYNPCLQEQQKIAKLLSLLDDRIATQNKIIDKLQSLIKGLVVTHYSTNPHTIKAKIRDLGEAYSTMSMSKEQLTANGNPCIFYGELFTIYGCVVDEVKSRTHIEKGLSTLSRGRDLLFPASTTVDALSLIAPSALMEKDIILGGDMFAIKISQEYNPVYLSYYFNYIANKRLSKYAKGTTIIHLHYNEIANVVVELPSIEEQGKIVAAIQGYTTKLDIEEALLERILDLKQYLLRQMFI